MNHKALINKHVEKSFCTLRMICDNAIYVKVSKLILTNVFPGFA